MPTGTIKLISPAGELIRHGRYKNNADIQIFKDSCKSTYGAKVLSTCTFDQVEDPKPPPVVKPDDGPAVIRQNSPWRKGRGISKGGSTGKKIPIKWPGKYY